MEAAREFFKWVRLAGGCCEEAVSRKRPWRWSVRTPRIRTVLLCRMMTWWTYFLLLSLAICIIILITAPSAVTKMSWRHGRALMVATICFLDGLATWAFTLRLLTAWQKVVGETKMIHSQAVKSAEFEPWVASEKSETVICAHCNCKAELRAARAVFFLLIAHSDAKLEASCTSQACPWLPPSLQPVEYKTVAEMDFTSPAKKAKLYSSSSPAVLSLPSIHKSSNLQAQPPSSSELDQLCKKLSE